MGAWGIAVAVAVAGCATDGTPREQRSAADRLAELEAPALKPVEPAPLGAAGVVVMRNAVVWTAAGQRHDPGFVVLRGERIEAVGAGEPPAVAGAHVIDVERRFVTPGLIDTHSHLGVYPSPSARAHADGNEMTSPNTADVWAEHGSWPQDPGFQRALAGGVTTLQVLEGSANLIGGRAVTLRTVPARGTRAMKFPGAPVGVKMACGENPKRVYGGRNQAPQTRMANVRGQRQAFLKAQKLVRELEAGKTPERDLASETLAGLLTGRLVAHVHCYRADDMLAFLAIADEFGFQVRSFHHALEAYKIADVLAARGISVSTWADWWGSKLEMFDGVPDNAALVAAAGGRAIIHSDSSRDIQRLNQEAAKALVAGQRAGLRLTEEDALRWVTANPAWALGIDGQTGTLEAGKRADVVVWDGHPLSVYGQARWVFVDGALRYDRTRPGAPWSDFELGQGAP